jgi:hypothetical protein
VPRPRLILGLALVAACAGTSIPGAAAGSAIYPLPAPVARPTHCPPPPPKHTAPTRPIAPTPAVSEDQVPAPIAQSGRVVDLTSVQGTGIWVTVFKGGTIDADAIVSKASAAHLRSIWIRTGGTYGGRYAGSVLKDLLPLAHARGLKVIAWDFPTLSDPVSDAARLVRTLRYTSPSGDQVDGVSGDVESRTEGVFLTPKRVAAYFSRISAYAGPRPVIATVYRPTDHWWGTNGGDGAYPYRAEAPFVDVFAPMLYWGCNYAGPVTQQAVDRLKALRPVHTIGQAYDMYRDGAGRPGLPTPQEIWWWLDTSASHGAIGGSLYLYSQMRGPQWRALWGFPGWKSQPAVQLTKAASG